MSADELRALARGPIALTERPSDAAVTLHDVRVALEQAASDRAALHRVRRLRQGLAAVGYWREVADLDAALRDEQNGGARE